MAPPCATNAASSTASPPHRGAGCCSSRYSPRIPAATRYAMSAILSSRSSMRSGERDAEGGERRTLAGGVAEQGVDAVRVVGADRLEQWPLDEPRERPGARRRVGF